MRFADQLSDFARYMTDEKGLSPYSVRSHCSQTSRFLKWFDQKALPLISGTSRKAQSRQSCKEHIRGNGLN